MQPATGPMRVLVTGAKGTLGPHLVRELEARGHSCQAWDRGTVSPEDREACGRFLDACDADAVAHLALGSEDWAEQGARWCAQRSRPFLYTSSAMVFGNEPDGPHRPGDERSGRDDYGRYKARCEDRILAAHPGATVARIGWQIGLTRSGGNDMLEHLCATHEREGELRASSRWIPACSFLVDTAEALATLLEKPAPGVLHLDGNAESAWTFLEVVRAIAHVLGDSSWTIESTEDYVHDQRLLDEVPRVASIARRLG